MIISCYSIKDKKLINQLKSFFNSYISDIEDIT